MAALRLASMSSLLDGVTYRKKVFSFKIIINMVIASHKRRIKTEKKATVVAAVWGTELVRFLAVLAILHQDDWKKDMNSSHRVMNNI